MNFLSAQARAQKVHRYLQTLYPNPQCALVYTRDYELLMAVILSAQTTDKQVNKVTPSLFAAYSSLEEIATASVVELEQTIQSIGLYRSKARNLQATARVLLEDFNGKVPRTLVEIIRCPGAARKTANVVLWELYGIAEGIAVDTHVKRLARQLKLTEHVDPIKIEQDLIKLFPQNDWGNVSHRFILYGREHWPARQIDKGDLAEIASVSSSYQ